jgi:hypothetical protein
MYTDTGMFDDYNKLICILHGSEGAHQFWKGYADPFCDVRGVADNSRGRNQGWQGANRKESDETNHYMHYTGTDTLTWAAIYPKPDTLVQISQLPVDDENK